MAVAVAAVSGSAAPAAEGGSGQRPRYEVAANGETGGRAAAWIELDAAVPLGEPGERRGALFVQPGAVLSQGPDGRTLLGGTLGVVYRFGCARVGLDLEREPDVRRPGEAAAEHRQPVAEFLEGENPAEAHVARGFDDDGTGFAVRVVSAIER